MGTNALQWLIIVDVTIAVHPCDTKNKGGCDHICNKKGEGVECSCKAGFQLEEDGESCEKVHPCDQPTKGGCQQLCNKKGDEAVCSCRKGFTLEEDGRKCEEGK